MSIDASYDLDRNWTLGGKLGYRSTQSAAGTTQTGVLGAVYKHLGNNVKVGVGYNFSTFSDDLTDLTQDDEGAFINLIAKF
jgi:hypothetical protein